MEQEQARVSRFGGSSTLIDTCIDDAYGIRVTADPGGGYNLWKDGTLTGSALSAAEVGQRLGPMILAESGVR